MEQAVVVHWEERKEDVLDEIMTRYGQDIYRLVNSYVRDQVVAEDLTQEIFIKVHKSLHTFKRNAKLRTWIWRIAINHCNDYLRSWHYRSVFVSDSLFDLEPTDDVVETIVTKEKEAELITAVANLPTKYREAIFLYYYEELPLKEIEVRTGSNLSTVKSRLHRAKKLLKKELTPGHGAGSSVPGY